MKYNNKSAYTLIEMIVSISIIAIISTIFINNYHSVNKKTDLTFAAQEVVSDTHKAQSNALGLIKYDGEVPEGGWGIHFSLFHPNQYIIFADLNSSHTMDEGEYDVDKGARVVQLPSNISIINIILNSSTSNEVDITFIPPNPITNITDNGFNTFDSVQIKLTDTTALVQATASAQTYKTMRVNLLGLAEIID